MLNTNEEMMEVITREAAVVNAFTTEEMYLRMAPVTSPMYTLQMTVSTAKKLKLWKVIFWMIARPFSMKRKRKLTTAPQLEMMWRDQKDK